jgi:hypothetical protein
MTDLEKVNNLCDHLVACADLWEGSGVSRVRTIKRTAEEIRALVRTLATPPVT